MGFRGFDGSGRAGQELRIQAARAHTRGLDPENNL